MIQKTAVLSKHWYFRCGWALFWMPPCLCISQSLSWRTAQTVGGAWENWGRYKLVRAFLPALEHKVVVPQGRASGLDCQSVSKGLDEKVSGKCWVCQWEWKKPMGQVIPITAVTRRESPWFSWQCPCCLLATRWMPVRPFSMWNFFCDSECSSLGRRTASRWGMERHLGLSVSLSSTENPPHVPASMKTGRNTF